jgi:hypothetical protein
VLALSVKGLGEGLLRLGIAGQGRAAGFVIGQDALGQ